MLRYIENRLHNTNLKEFDTMEFLKMISFQFLFHLVFLEYKDQQFKIRSSLVCFHSPL
jgi:hypothetical protein